jgi:hypothetical protein
VISGTSNIFSWIKKLISIWSFIYFYPQFYNIT